MAARLDPRFSRAVLSAGKGDVLGATVVLASDITSSDETFEQAVSRVVSKAAGGAATSPARVTSYPGLRAIAIDAPAGFLRELIKNPAVESASLSSRDQDVLIHPVGTEKVTLQEGMRRQNNDRKKPSVRKGRDKAGDKKKSKPASP